MSRSGLLGYTITLGLAYTKIYIRSVEMAFKPRQFGMQVTSTITLCDFASVLMTVSRVLRAVRGNAHCPVIRKFRALNSHPEEPVILRTAIVI